MPLLRYTLSATYEVPVVRPYFYTVKKFRKCLAFLDFFPTIKFNSVGPNSSSVK
jgi:hypothetical protein